MENVPFILDTFWLLFSGILVMFMAAGFAMLESGLVRSKNTTGILLKNISLYSISCLAFLGIGYNLMYGSGFNLGLDGTSAEGHTLLSDFFFQMVFVATAASIISGSVAERIKFWPFMGFVVLLASFIYPIQGSWSWGGTKLYGIMEGFSDFAGSTIVHSVGGWAALAAVLLLGARIGKYTEDGKVNPIPGANLPLATIGTFILWFGWFGFNAGSQLAMGSKENMEAISSIIVNTHTAACAGGVIAMIMSQILFKKVDLTMVLNGTLAGLVAITAGPDYPSSILSFIIGGVGGTLATFAVIILDKLKIDDPVGAIPVHLVNGIWGTLAVGIFNPEVSLMSQVIGIVCVGAFTFSTSYVIWFVMKKTVGIRITKEEELMGTDLAHFGLKSYPEFYSGDPNIHIEQPVKEYTLPQTVPSPVIAR